MEEYLFYVTISCLTIASPGPGVLLTLTNSLTYGLKNALPGILGVALGMGGISIIAASSVGAIISSSAWMMNIVKLLGAAYLIYLGLKLLRSKPKLQNTLNDITHSESLPSVTARFRQVFFVSMLNPKPIVFFMALFPQFIKADQPFAPQFTLLASTFCTLVFLIHFVYGYITTSARQKISLGRGFLIINRVGGIVFICFSAALILSINVNLIINSV
ncbi:LysE family translocator [Pseudomonas gingeri]|uniref:LysE family translocator n=1 Tax=Pseudomonas gingeri TaxID=117681 RepID=A0A7Y7WV50_9PSED|nr:LysE family translocator [Pseudomonas gingeri]